MTTVNEIIISFFSPVCLRPGKVIILFKLVDSIHWNGQVYLVVDVNVAKDFHVKTLNHLDTVQDKFSVTFVLARPHDS